MAAGSFYNGDDDAPITDINVTPLVDVMLVLLVIFIVTARLIASRGVEVSRPAGPGAPVVGPILVTVDKDGALYVEGDVYPDAKTAVARLKELAGGTDDAKAIIDGDKAAAYDGVMRAITIISAAGIKHIALASTPVSDIMEP
jgi:biopolymer transport protein ExbD